MAASFRSSSNASSTGTTSLSINVPAGVVDGDLLYLSVLANDDGGTPSITTPSGWTALETNNALGGATDRVFSIFWREASSEPASYSISISSTSVAIAEMVAIQGASHFGYALNDNGSTSTPNPPSVASAPDGSVAIAGEVAVRGNTSSISATPPSGYTEAEDVNLTPSESTGMSVAYQDGVSGTVDPGTFTLANTAAAESFTLIAEEAGPDPLVAAQGSFSLAGQSAGLLASYKLTAEQGSFSASGQEADLIASRLLSASQGNFSLTGYASGLLLTFTLSAGQGNFDLTGQATELISSFKLPAAHGDFTLTGQSADLVKTYHLAAAQGSFSLAGQSADLVKTYHLAAAQGSFTLTGVDAALSLSKILRAAVGSFSLTGQDAALSKYLLGSGFFQEATTPANDDDSGASFYNQASGNSGSSAGFYDSHSGTGGDKAGFYGG